MATSALNPNAQPWFFHLPNQIIHHPTLVPYYIYDLSPVAGQPPPSQIVESSTGHFRRRAPVRKGWKTTVMIKNIPNQFSRDMLVNFVDQICRDQNSQYEFHPRRIPFEYDFVYLPFDFERGYNLGYAFVNFTSPFIASRVWRLLGGYVWGTFIDDDNNWHQSKKICEITWARIQGNHELVRHFKNSKFVCDNINYLPILFTPPRDGSVSLVSPTTIGSLSGFAPHGYA